MNRHSPASGRDAERLRGPQGSRSARRVGVDSGWAAKSALAVTQARRMASMGSRRVLNRPRCPSCGERAGRLVGRVYAGGALRETVCGRCAVGRSL